MNILCFVSQSGFNSKFESSLEEYLKLCSFKRINLCPNRCFDLEIESVDDSTINKVKQLANSFQIDCAYFRNNRTPKKLIVFDMDSTLIQAEVIDEMAKAFGIGEQIKVITERAMQGELNFDQALKERIALLKGFHFNDMEHIYSQIKFNPGVEKVMSFCRKKNIKTAIASGGFRFYAERFQKRLNMDFSFANELDFQNNQLTGKVIGEIINAQKKAEILNNLSQKLNIKNSETVAVGDGANDLLMLKTANLGIAYMAKEKVQRESEFHINFNPMSALLYYLGFSGDHFNEAI